MKKGDLMETTVIEKNDELVMKLLHYFITEKSYNPIVLHGAKNEIWLENLDEDYKIVRIVTNYIHNDDQFEFDIFRTKQIVKRIKKKTFSLNLNTLSIFLNLGENVHFDANNFQDNLIAVDVKDISDLDKYKTVTKYFPDITKSTDFKEDGLNLFLKLTKEINEKNQEENVKAEDIFSPKKPIVTYEIIAINVIVFILMYILGNGSEDAYTLIKFGANVPEYIKAGEYYRLLTSAFLHIGVFHLLCNNYALYIIGSQLESFLGKTKFLIVYLVSAICGNLMSLLFTTGISAGASGAIFGLLGSLLYFGYYYRVYLGNLIHSQIIPVILLNLCIGFLTPGIDNAAHIGGLIGGILSTMAVGLKYKSKKSDRINGVILTVIFISFLVYLGFFR